MSLKSVEAADVSNQYLFNHQADKNNFPHSVVDISYKVSMVACLVLGIYIGIQSEALSERLEAFSITVSGMSVISLLWSVACVVMGQYQKAVKGLVFAGCFGIVSLGADRIASAFKEVDFLSGGSIDADHKYDSVVVPMDYPISQGAIDSLNWSERLSMFPKIPSRSYPINYENATNWINAHPCALQRIAARKVIDATRHITHREFEEALKDSVSKFNRWLDEQDSKKYAMLVTKEGSQKSNRWVAELALKYLDELPRDVLGYPRYQFDKQSSLHFTSYVVNRLRFPQVKTYVVVDDGAFSCDQIMGTINVLSRLGLYSFCQNEKYLISAVGDRHVCSLESLERWERSIGEYTIVVIIPFMRDFECILKRLPPENTRSKVVVFSSEKLPTVGEVLSSGEMQSLGFEYTPEKVTAYFDHKIADSVSVPEQSYVSGAVYLPENPCPESVPERHCKEKDCSDIYKKGYYTFNFSNTKFIENIVPPYK